MEIVQIIIFIVAIAFAITIEMKKQARKNEVSDSIEPDEQTSADDSQEEWIPTDLKDNLCKTNIQKTEEKNTPQPQKEKKSIRIKGKSDARRAFIYSEIFQRKY